MADDIGSALKKERRILPDECYVDPDWSKLQDDKVLKRMGFEDNGKSKKTT